MPPTIILIRHAEAEHNATENWDLSDPLLTPKGEEQCRALQEHLLTHCPVAKDVEAIITSPLRRTLQTTLSSLDFLVQPGVPVEVDAKWQENSISPCDTGSPLSSLIPSFPTLDFSAVDPTFPDKAPSSPYAFTRTAVLARGQTCLQALYARPEKAIAVVSHSAFLRTAVARRRFANADYRVFRLRRRGHVVGVVEDSRTARKGGGMGRSVKGVQGVEEWDFPEEEEKEEEEGVVVVKGGADGA